MARGKKKNTTKSFDAPPPNKISPSSSNFSEVVKPKPKLDNQFKGFNFISNTYSVHLECPLCQQLMIRPMRVHPCGHSFCQNCIESFMSLDKKLCPFKNCLRKFQIIQNDRTAQNLIDQLKVQCTNEPCVYKGTYDHYKKHHKETCAFKNGGIDTWLGNLTQGLILTQKASQLAQKFDQDQLLDSTQKRENLENPIEENANEDSQNIDSFENLQKQVEKQEKTDGKFSQSQKQKIDERNLENDGQKKERQQEKSVSNPYSLNNSSSDSGRDLNFSIFNIPFGPSIRQQINSEENRSNEFFQKQMKKLQG